MLSLGKDSNDRTYDDAKVIFKNHNTIQSTEYGKMVLSIKLQILELPYWSQNCKEVMYCILIIPDCKKSAIFKLSKNVIRSFRRLPNGTIMLKGLHDVKKFGKTFTSLSKYIESRF